MSAFTLPQVAAMEPAAAGSMAASAVESTSNAITESSSSAVSITGAMGSDWQGDGYNGAASAMNTLHRAHTTTASNVDSLAQAITTALNDVQSARATVLNLVGQATGAGMLVTPTWQVIPIIPTAATMVLAQMYQVVIGAAVADLVAADQTGAQAITAAAQAATSSSSGNPYIKNVLLQVLPFIIAGAEAAGGAGLGAGLTAGGATALGLGNLLFMPPPMPKDDAPLLGQSRSPLNIDQDKKRDGDIIATGLDTDDERVDCRDENSVYISYKDNPEYAQHVLDAQANGHPSVLHPDREKGTAYVDRRRKAATNAPRDANGDQKYPSIGTLGNKSDTSRQDIDGMSNDILPQNYKSDIHAWREGNAEKPRLERDEYPPAMFAEGGHGASVKYMDSYANFKGGDAMKKQLKNTADGESVCILVEP